MMEEELANVVVYRHLLHIAPNLASEFITTSKIEIVESACDNWDVDLRKVLHQFSIHLKVATLVHRHLMEVTPTLAQQFKQSSHFLPFIIKNELSLKDTVHHFRKSGRNPDCEDLGIKLDGNSNISWTGNNNRGKIVGISRICDVPVYDDLKSALKDSSDLDKIVLFILGKNINISNIHAKITNTNDIKKSDQRLKLGNVDYGRFTPHENEIIKKNWDKLIEEVAIERPDFVLNKLFNLKIKDGINELLKKNVIGLYLGQGITKVRLASQLIKQALRILLNFVTGKISNGEHSIILDYIEKHGESHQSFSDLRVLLRRLTPTNIYMHYKKWKEGKLESSLKRGPFTKIESQIIIKEMLKTSNDGTVLGVHSNVKGEKGTVTTKTFQKLEDVLKRPVQNIRNQWEMRLKPTLLRYHAGTLNFDVRTILVNYLLEKQIRFIQDIPWNQVLACPQFSGHTKDSLTKEFEKVTLMTMNRLKIQRNRITIADISETVKVKLSEHKVNLSGKVALVKKELIEFYKTLLAKDYNYLRG